MAVARKVGNHIYVEEDATIDEVALAINDANFFIYDEPTKTGRFVGDGVSRDLRVRTGGKLTIRDGETLELYSSRNGYADFIVEYGGELEVFGAVTIDAGVNNKWNNFYFYGKVFMHGGDAEEDYILVNNFNKLHFYRTQSTHILDSWHVHNLKLGKALLANAYGIYFGDIPEWLSDDSFKNLIFDTQGTGNNDAYGIMTQGDDLPPLKIENLEYRSGQGIYIYAPFHLKNFHFKSTNGYPLLSYGYKMNTNIYHPRLTNPPRKNYGQTFLFVEASVWDANYSYSVLFQKSAHILLKNCLFNNDAKIFYTQNKAKAMFWGEDNLPTKLRIYTKSSVNIVYALSLNITDGDGQPIKDAIINIREITGKEEMLFYSDINGDINSIHGLNKAFLTHKLIYYATSTEDTWLSEIWGNYVIEVLKKGYEAQIFNVEMTEDREVSVVMLPPDPPAAVINQGDVIVKLFVEPKLTELDLQVNAKIKSTNVVIDAQINKIDLTTD